MLKKPLAGKGAKESKLLYLNKNFKKGIKSRYFIDGTKPKPIKRSTTKSNPNTTLGQSPSVDWESRVNVKIRYPNQSSSTETVAQFNSSRVFKTVYTTSNTSLSSSESMPRPQRSSVLPIKIKEANSKEQQTALKTRENTSLSAESMTRSQQSVLLPIKIKEADSKEQQTALKAKESLNRMDSVVTELSRSQLLHTEDLEEIATSTTLKLSKNSINAVPERKRSQLLNEELFHVEHSKYSLTAVPERSRSQSPHVHILGEFGTATHLERSKSSITARELNLDNSPGSAIRTLTKSTSVSYKISERSLSDMGYDKSLRENWPKYYKSDKPDLFTTLRHVIENNIRPSFTVYIGDSEYSCHLIVLQIYSDFFKEISDEFAIFLPQEKVSLSSFKIIYKWMLSDAAELTRENILDVYCAAKFLSVDVLVDQCWKLIGDDKLFVEYTAFLLYVEARLKDMHAIKSLMESRIYKFFLTLVASKEFLLLPIEDVKSLLSVNTIGVNSEMEVFFIVTRWLNFDWKERKGFTADLMSCVRFQLIPCWFLITLEKINMGIEVNRVINSFDFKKTIKDCLTYATAMSHFQGQEDAVKEFLGQTPFETPKQRLWIFDPNCSHHHNINCPGMRLFTYKVFLAYLLTLHKRKKGYWKSLQEVNPKNKQCCQSCEFNMSSVTVKKKEESKKVSEIKKSSQKGCKERTERKVDSQKGPSEEAVSLEKRCAQKEHSIEKIIDKNIKISDETQTDEYDSLSSEEIMERNGIAVVNTFNKRSQDSLLSEIDSESNPKTQRTVVEQSKPCIVTEDKLEKSQSTKVAIEKPQCKSLPTLESKSLSCVRKNLVKCTAYDSTDDEACLLAQTVRSKKHSRGCELDESEIESSTEELSRSSLSEVSTDSSTDVDNYVEFRRGTEEKLLIFGGHDPVLKSADSISDHHGNSGNHVLYYDNNTHIWKHLTHIPFGPRKHFSTVKCNGKVYVLGGTLYKCDNETLDGNVWSFDPSLVKWALETRMPEPRKDFAAVAIEGIAIKYKEDIRIKGRGIFVIGGQDMEGHILGTVWFFDVIRKIWEQKCPLVTPRYGLMAVVINNEILAAGGVTQMCVQAATDESQTEEDSNESSSFNHLVITSSVEIFKLSMEHYATKQVNGFIKYSADSENIEFNKWVLSKNRLRVPRLFGRFCLCSHSILYLSGGIIKQRRQSLQTLAAIDCFNFQTKEWFHAYDMDCSRHGHDMVEYKDALVIIGGVTSIGSNCRALSEVFMYDFKNDIILRNIKPLPWPISGAGIVVI